MTEFSCSCAGCGRQPDFGKTGIWVESDRGMLCEECWRGLVGKTSSPAKESGESPSEHEFCCFCALCKRTPPDPEYKIWIETASGCLCEKCWKEAAAALINSRAKNEVPKENEAVDIQFGCCLINKKLLLKVLDALPSGGTADVIAENSDVVKSTVGKYVKDKGCKIESIEDKNGTCIIRITRP